MRRAEDFRLTVRRGIRVARPTLVLHADRDSTRDGVLVGFVVSKAVGNAVQRNQLKRRLRHIAAARLAEAPVGTDFVVRALPRAAAEPDRLADDLPAAWTTAVARLAVGRPETSAVR